VPVVVDLIFHGVVYSDHAMYFCVSRIMHGSSIMLPEKSLKTQNNLNSKFLSSTFPLLLSQQLSRNRIKHCASLRSTLKKRKDTQETEEYLHPVHMLSKC